MDKILVTGGTGFFGLNFLRKKDKNVYLLGHKRILKKKNNQIIYLNKVNKKNIIKLIFEKNIKIIIHAAAITNLEFAEKNKSICYNTNYKFTKTISDITKLLNLKLVFISTDQLYDQKKGYSLETQKVKTPNYYSHTKSLSEKYIKKNNKYYWIIRCSFFGWGTIYKNSLTDFVFNNLKKKEEISLWSNIYFNPIYVSELIDITKKIIYFPSGIYNLGTKSKLSKLEFGIILAKIFKLNKGYIKEIKYIDKNVIRPKDMSVNIEKIMSTFPKKKFDLAHHINLLVSDYKKFRKNLLKY